MLKNKKFFQAIQTVLFLGLFFFAAWLNMGAGCGGCNCKKTTTVACEYDCGKCYVYKCAGTADIECDTVKTQTCCKNLSIKCKAKFRDYTL